MAKTPGARPTVQKTRPTPASKPVVSPAVASTASVEAPAKKKRTSLPQFIAEVRAAARKVTWTSRKETWITSVMVFIMVVTVSLFLFLVDFLCNLGVNGIIKLGS
jgi:preprotein translocase subunit SecE